MLEMIAVAAAMKEDGQDEKSLLRTFSKFLEDVAKITELRLGFKKLGPGKWVMDDGRKRLISSKYNLQCNFFLIWLYRWFPSNY